MPHEFTETKLRDPALRQADASPPERISCGEMDVAPAWRRLRCGLLEVHFDPAGGWLRCLRVEGREVVRAIYGAVRDRGWGTVLPWIEVPTIVDEEDAFRISFAGECVAEEMAFRWRGEIVGEEYGVLRFDFAGQALTGFWRNRIGLCVLHPIEGCAGEKCRVETGEGSVAEEMFPRFISPHQPFRNVRAMTHAAGDDCSVEVRFEGEIFETEDQRNWTDASFKTYGTPLAEPFPVWVEHGTRITQSVTVRLMHAPATRVPVARRVEPEPIPELSVTGENSRPLPPVGFGMTGHGMGLTDSEAALLRRLRVDLRLGESGWPARWRMAVADAAMVGASLHAAVFVTDDAARELAALASEMAAHPAPVSLWLIFHTEESATDARWVRMAEAVLPPGAPSAAGTDANFAELNRTRPDAAETALPCFPMNPQVHAFDDASLIENLGAQAATIESARQFAPRPVVISPITLRPRSQAANADPRQARTPLFWMAADIADQLPGIKFHPRVCDGSTRLAGTRLRVWTLESWRRLGAGDEEIPRSHPTLKPSDLLNALAVGNPAPARDRSGDSGKQRGGVNWRDFMPPKTSHSKSSNVSAHWGTMSSRRTTWADPTRRSSRMTRCFDLRSKPIAACSPSIARTSNGSTERCHSSWHHRLHGESR